jgi:hypothetical protein
MHVQELLNVIEPPLRYQEVDDRIVRDLYLFVVWE